jgi:bifunctional DNA-binding transcriptional regulator/antitoxin component of YhaV-PrlF toxin-antitoxin module
VPLTEIERFPAKLQRRGRVQVPVMIRWRYRLEDGEVLRVGVRSPVSFDSEVFYGRLLKDGRITVPKLVVDLLEIEHGDIVNVTLYAQKEPEKKES